jgi:hypothetical protein
VVFDTDGAVRGIPHNAFDRTAKSIAARWFVKNTTKHNGLYNFRSFGSVIPNVLWVYGGCIALSSRITGDC